MSRIDEIGERALQRTGGPSISIATVENGRPAYFRVFGEGGGAPVYNVASVTKQFIAAAMLLLVRAGKLSLDDTVARFFPQLSRSSDISIRHLLSHTSGYPDYYPLGYADEEKLVPAAPEEIVARYATGPLQFEPGTQWSYSNTGYHIAGLIIEQVAQMQLGDFLRETLLEPAGMTGAFFNDPPHVLPQHAPAAARFALGPLRPAPGERAGWMWAAGGLACSARDLAAWHQSFIDCSILTPAETAEMTRAFMLRDGTPSATALGWFAEQWGAYAVVQHSGGISGYAAQTIVARSERASVVVLASGDHVQTGSIARDVFLELLPDAEPPAALPGGDAEVPQSVRTWLERFTRGDVDREHLTRDAAAFLSPDRLADAREGLAAAGALRGLELLAQGERGGMAWTKCRASFAAQEADVLIRETADGRLAEFSAYPVP